MSKRGVFIAVGVFIAIIVCSITLIVMANEERFKTIALERVSDKLDMALSVGEIEMSVWSEFPKVRVDLNNISLGGATNSIANIEDTLLIATRLGVAFSLWEVLFSDPVIEAVILEDVQLFLKQSSGGDWNTSVFKDKESDKEEAVQVNVFRFIDVSIQAKSNNNEIYRVDIDRANIKGVDFDLSFRNGVLEGSDASEELLPLFGNLRGEITLKNEDDIAISLENSEINGISLKGNCNLFEGFLAEIQVSQVGVSQLKNIVSEEALKKKRKGFIYEGKASLDISVDESKTSVKFILLESDLSIAPEITGFSMVKTGRFSAEGTYEYFSKKNFSAMTIQSFKFDSKGLEVLGDAKCSNLNTDNWQINSQSVLDTQSPYSSWIPELQSAEYSYLPKEGELEVSSELSISPWGKLGEFTFTVESEKLNGTLNGVPYSINNLTAHFNNQICKVNGLEYSWGGNVGVIECDLLGVDKWLSGGLVKGNVDLQAKHIDVTSILKWWGNVSNTEAESDSDEQNNSSFLPSGSEISLKIESPILIWNALECHGFLSRVNVTPSKVHIINATTKGLEGMARVEGAFRPSNEGWVINLSGSADGLSLPKLFNCYDNFSQNTLRAQHLGGSLSVAGSIKMGWGSDGVWSPESLNSNLDLSVSHGILENFEVFDDVADYLQEHRLMAPLVDPNDLRERLKKIQFENLESSIFISSSKTNIPNINIHSSAMGVSVEGVHSFTGEIDYTLGFALRDLRKSREVEFGSIEDDGLGTMFFLAMDGTLENPVYSYDRTAHKSHRRQALKDEAKRIKDAIQNHEEKTEEKAEGKFEEKTEEKQKRTNEQKSNDLNDIEDDDF